MILTVLLTVIPSLTSATQSLANKDGIIHAWQLSHLEREDWVEAGATGGLGTAVRAVLKAGVPQASHASRADKERRAPRRKGRWINTPFQVRYGEEAAANSRPTGVHWLKVGLKTLTLLL